MQPIWCKLLFFVCISIDEVIFFDNRYTLLMKHYMITRNSEQLSLVFAGAVLFRPQISHF